MEKTDTTGVQLAVSVFLWYTIYIIVPVTLILQQKAVII